MNMAFLRQCLSPSPGFSGRAPRPVHCRPGNRLGALTAGLVFAAAILAIGVGAQAQETPYLPAAEVIHPQAYVSLQPVPRGRLFEIAVVAKIASGFHVNAHEPSEDYLIPTRITADLPAGIRLVESTYPRGVMRKFRFANKPLRVYEGSFTVRMKLRAEGGAALGPRKIGLTVAYQACNQEACLPPTKVPATAELEVAAEDTPAFPANPAIFSPASPPKFPGLH